MSGHDQSFILLLLADSNLPTGGFVASAGLEAFAHHGQLGLQISSQQQNVKLTEIVNFVDHNLAAYARSSLSSLRAAHAQVEALSTLRVPQVLQALGQIDKAYHAITLNHVVRRASTAQGVALLSLYSRAFSYDSPLIDELVEKFRARIRSGQIEGHLPVCFAILTAGLGLKQDASVELHLFLHARSILSSAVRLNLIGPYQAHRILLQQMQPLIKRAAADNPALYTFELIRPPATIWPLAEILAARHDVMNTRIFNS
ncbi:uncharacterized protein L969DRAFT_44302 [Mixia osmundae IAM 14324]|uniref:Urease accessory protein UreF n=1 Tax=Mixia osmundae (strain CBS 9802 / IAM 14324 / JCM 22182 / KY 12970) TaxID=764103 RepID=G7E317_MIXOS|nr:uncharacterized protein L969DRAFT_44302 [Mixia osmundae IAM 14324]KEI42513.1 hypothetical protein L969DRAFT_44302 [Mixia osmundae IAM 14324]GAA97198.1 hypothetical protein E5Q_03874 [Mixia osmundae IAM 14324]